MHDSVKSDSAGRSGAGAGDDRGVRELLQRAADRLRRAGIDSPDVDAALLLAHACGLRSHLDVWVPGRARLTPAKERRFREYIERRERREPLQYITGTAGFFGLDLVVGPGVLPPRPETERLVELALAALRPPGPVCDMCTGSGAVACALAVHIRDVQIAAVDRSVIALDYAARNRDALGLRGRLHLVASDLFSAFPPRPVFSLITVNPPYIADAEFAELPAEVARYEPREALDGGPDGLEIIRRIAESARLRLLPGGRLLCEIGAGQAATAADCFLASGRRRGWREVAVHEDLAGRPRVLEAW